MGETAVKHHKNISKLGFFIFLRIQAVFLNSLAQNFAPKDVPDV